MDYLAIEYEVKPPPVRILQVFESRLNPQIVHCLAEDQPPIGKSRILWEVKLVFQPNAGINIESPDIPDFMIYLNTMQAGRCGGDRVVSRFSFSGLFAALIYTPPPHPPKLLQIEHDHKILLHVRAEGKHLEEGFRDLYPQLALKMTKSPVRTYLLNQPEGKKEVAHLTKR